MSDLPSSVPDWRRAYGVPVMRAGVRSSSRDFQVREWLGFEPDGDGEHDFLYVEKEGQNTVWVADLLAKAAGLRANDVGFAGMKDRKAVTRQWFSVRRPAGCKTDWHGFTADGVRVLEVTRHGRKLKRGAHQGNHFRLALRNPAGEPGSINERLQAIREHGVPNYFGDQRFGHGARNIHWARQLFGGRRLPRARKSIALSAARSWIFNAILERRIAAGSWNRLLPGELANLDGSGSVFVVDTVDEALARRARELDVHPTGALWGKGRDAVSGEVLAIEKAVVEGEAGLAQGLEAQGVASARRALRVRIIDLRWEAAEDDVLWLEFSLGRGAFATSVLRELVEPPGPDPQSMSHRSLR